MAPGAEGKSARMVALLDAAPDAIFQVDAAGRIVFANATAVAMFGYSRDELLGANVEMLVPAPARRAHEGHLAGYRNRPINRPMGLGMELEGVRKDGHLLPVEISLSSVECDGEKLTIAIVRDVTERRRASEQMRQLREQFTAELEERNRQLEQRNADVERSSRLKTEFLSSVSHELRSPLHTIIGFADLLAEELEGPLNDRQKRFVTNIRDDSGHLLAIINDLLDISRIESGRMEYRPERFSLPEVVDEVVAAWELQISAKDLRVETAVPAGSWIEADRLRFKQILINLISNAIKFTRESGRIQIAAAVRGQVALVRVTDSGIGIAPENQPAIFEKFFQVGATTHGLPEGTGLGLPIAAQMVIQQGGDLWVESGLGLGSSFLFTAKGVMDTEPRPLAVLVEGVYREAELLAEYLRPAGVDVVATSSPARARKLTGELHPELLLLDLDPVSVEGVIDAIIPAAENADPGPRVVVVSSSDQKIARPRGAVQLTKPVSKRALTGALEGLLGGGFRSR